MPPKKTQICLNLLNSVINDFDVVKLYKQLQFIYGSNEYLNSIINNSEMTLQGSFYHFFLMQWNARHNVLLCRTANCKKKSKASSLMSLTLISYIICKMKKNLSIQPPSRLTHPHSTDIWCIPCNFIQLVNPYVWDFPHIYNLSCLYRY